MSVLLYLAAPAWLFLLGFCRPLLGWPLAVLLLLALLCCLDQRRVEPRRLLPALLGGLLVTWLSGFPFGPFASDWIKHWALLDELSRRDWPVVLELQEQTQYLRFYLGAYLLPAGLSKLTALPVWLSTLLWFGLGYVLVFRSLLQVIEWSGRAWLAPLLLLALAGADAYAEQLFRSLLLLPAVPWLGMHFEAWAFNAAGLPIEYSGILTALTWVPHQSIATFLVCGMFAAPREQRQPARLALALGLLALWSPYGLIGLLPLALQEAWSRRIELGRGAVLTCLLVAILFALLVAWYLSADLPGAGACFSCLPGRLAHWLEFAPFVLLELLPFGLLLGAELWRDRQCRLVLLCLLLLPLMYGETPDFVMRASLGPLFLLSIRSVQRLLKWAPGFRHRLALLAALCLSLPTALSEAVYLRQGGAAHRNLSERDPMAARWMRLSATQHAYTAEQFFELCGWNFVGQYFSRKPPTPLQVPSH